MYSVHVINTFKDVHNLLSFFQERESPFTSTGQVTEDRGRVDIPDTYNVTSVSFTNDKRVDNNTLAVDTKDGRTPQEQTLTVNQDRTSKI